MCLRCISLRLLYCFREGMRKLRKIVKAERFLSFILAFSLFICLFCFDSFALSADDYIINSFDFNEDGKVTTADARILLRYALKIDIIKPSEVTTQPSRNPDTAGTADEDDELVDISSGSVHDYTGNPSVSGDVNSDGKVTTADARLLLRYALKLESAESILNSFSPVIPDPPVNKNTYPENFNAAALPDNRLLTPDTNHNLGKSAMISVKKDYAEMTPANVNNMKSYPLMSPFIKGTYDYVTKSAAIGGEFVYGLKSGANIKAEDVNYISSGYIMPDNTVTFTGLVSEEKTDIYLKTLWQVPMCVQFKPQKYFTGYDNRPYNLSEFTAEYMEVQFSHTVSGSGEIKFPSNSIFSSASWSTANSTKVTTLRLNFAEAGEFYGYDLSSENGYIKISAKNKIPSVKGKTIVIDPGHGGSDGGGGSNGVYESGINLKTANYLKDMLEKAGAKVIMTRTGNTEVSLESRRDITRKNNADLFLSIHCDVADAVSAAGVSVYYYYPYSMPYAKCLQTGLVNAYRSKVYSSSSANYGKTDRDIKFYPFLVARVETCPAVLIELGFLSNAEERAILQKDSTQQALAEGIYNGIVEYFK